MHARLLLIEYWILYITNLEVSFKLYNLTSFGECYIYVEEEVKRETKSLLTNTGLSWLEAYLQPLWGLTYFQHTLVFPSQHGLMVFFTPSVGWVFVCLRFVQVLQKTQNNRLQWNGAQRLVSYLSLNADCLKFLGKTILIQWKLGFSLETRKWPLKLMFVLAVCILSI